MVEAWHSSCGCEIVAPVSTCVPWWQVASHIGSVASSSASVCNPSVSVVPIVWFSCSDPNASFGDHTGSKFVGHLNTTDRTDQEKVQCPAKIGRGKYLCRCRWLEIVHLVDSLTDRAHECLVASDSSLVEHTCDTRCSPLAGPEST